MVGLPDADTVIATILTLLVCGKEAYGTDCSVTKLRCPPFRAQPSGCERRVLPGSLRNISFVYEVHGYGQGVQRKLCIWLVDGIVCTSR